MIDPNDPTNDPEAAAHRAKVDALLAGETPAPAEQKLAPAARPTVPTVELEQLPPLVPLEGSAQIAEYGYDRGTGHLFVRFHGKGKPGTLYRYANFGESDYQAFLDAESKGSHLGRNIKPFADRYPCERVAE